MGNGVRDLEHMRTRRVMGAQLGKIHILTWAAFFGQTDRVLNIARGWIPTPACHTSSSLRRERRERRDLCINI